MSDSVTGTTGLWDRGASLASRLITRALPLSSPMGGRAYVKLYDWYKSRVDEKLIRCALRQVRPGDIAVDIGANVGFYSLRLARTIGPSGAVIAFEPGSWASGHLARRARAQGLHNLRLHQAAVGESQGEATLFLGDFPADSRLWAPPRVTSCETVPVVTLDSVLDPSGQPPSLIKVDTQGAEVQVINGMRRTLADAPERFGVLLELWPAGLRAAGNDPAELFGLMEEHRLRAFTISSDGTTIAASQAELLQRCREHGYTDVFFGR